MITINDVRKIEFGKTYLWELMFDDNNINPKLPSYFRKWIPAITVEEELASVDSYSAQVYNTTLKFPEGTGAFHVNITFADDWRGSIRDWLTEWKNGTILQNGYCVATIGECAKILHTRKLNTRKEVVKGSEKAYLVYPEGDTNFNGDSESSLQTISATFVVVGTVKQSPPTTANKTKKL
jgi:hypothetical protein